MSLRLLLDEDTQAKRLIYQLREAGHDVETATEADLIHKPDRLVLAYAEEKSRIIMTRNCGDFHALHQALPFPPGVLAIHQHNTASDLSDSDIVTALAQLEAVAAETDWDFSREFIVLNQWESN